MLGLVPQLLNPRGNMYDLIWPVVASHNTAVGGSSKVRFVVFKSCSSP